MAQAIFFTGLKLASTKALITFISTSLSRFK